MSHSLPPKLRRIAFLVGTRVLVSAVVLFGGTITTNDVRAEEIRAQFAMREDPDLSPLPPDMQLQEGVFDLWRQALVRPESDYQRLAADAIAEAATDGFPGLDVARDDLVEILTAEATHPAAMIAAARALIALDDRSSVNALFEASQREDFEFRLLVEPVLWAWEFEPIRETWRSRLGDQPFRRRELILALEGLARAEDAASLPAMVRLVQSSQNPPDVRLAAARAAGAVAATGLEESAARLASGPRPGVLRRLCAVALLSRHSSEAARTQLLELAEDPEPTIAEQALGALHSIDPQLVLPLAERAMQSSDPKVRRRGADAYVTLPTPDRAAYLTTLLDDVHPDVRQSVRDDLLRLDENPDLSEAVRGASMMILDEESWRGQEQAALLLGALGHKPAAGRLIELLHAERREAMLAAAWALRSLAIPETAPALLEHAQLQTTRRREGTVVDGLDSQVAHLFEAMALMNFFEAEPLLREYIPKDAVHGHDSRGAAIWGLGHLYDDRPDEELVRQLTDRMNDESIINPELEIVQEMSATALGRMNATSQLPALETRLRGIPVHDRLAYAIRWSIQEITGEELPAVAPPIGRRINWFLEPLPPLDR